MNKRLIDDFCQLYQTLGKDNLNQLTNVYQQDIVFIDPIHEVQGLNALVEYFAHLYQNLLFCRFTIENIILGDEQASVFWTMHYRHSKINSAKCIAVNGCSLLKYTDKIYYHRDFFDMGQMLYEQLPVLGSLIKVVKKRASR